MKPSMNLIEILQITVINYKNTFDNLEMIKVHFCIWKKYDDNYEIVYWK